MNVVLLEATPFSLFFKFSTVDNKIMADLRTFEVVASLAPLNTGSCNDVGS